MQCPPRATHSDPLHLYNSNMVARKIDKFERLPSTCIVLQRPLPQCDSIVFVPKQGSKTHGGEFCAHSIRLHGTLGSKGLLRSKCEKVLAKDLVVLADIVKDQSC